MEVLVADQRIEPGFLLDVAWGAGLDQRVEERRQDPAKIRVRVQPDVLDEPPDRQIVAVEGVTMDVDDRRVDLATS